MPDVQRGSLEDRLAGSRSMSSGLASPMLLVWKERGRDMPKAPYIEYRIQAILIQDSPRCHTQVWKRTGQVAKGEEHASQ